MIYFIVFLIGILKPTKPDHYGDDEYVVFESRSFLRDSSNLCRERPDWSFIGRYGAWTGGLLAGINRCLALDWTSFIVEVPYYK